MSLEVSEDLAFQRRSWFVQRAGWIAMAAVVMAALLGGFGPGLLNRAETSTVADSLRVSYARAWRVTSPMELRVQLRPTPGADQAGVWLEQSYLERVLVNRVMPEPAQVRASESRVTYLFDLEPNAGGLTVIFYVEPQRFGLIRGRAGTMGGMSATFAHFVFP